MGPRAGLEGRKILSPPGFDPRPSVAIPSELPGPQQVPIITVNVEVFDVVLLINRHYNKIGYTIRKYYSVKL